MCSGLPTGLNGQHERNDNNTGWPHLTLDGKETGPDKGRQSIWFDGGLTGRVACSREAGKEVAGGEGGCFDTISTFPSLQPRLLVVVPWSCCRRGWAIPPTSLSYILPSSPRWLVPKTPLYSRCHVKSTQARQVWILSCGFAGGVVRETEQKGSLLFLFFFCLLHLVVVVMVHFSFFTS